MKAISFITAIIILGCNLCMAADFVNPIDFTGTKEEKEMVVDYIIENVKTTYSAIGMDDPLTLRAMEKEELAAFKRLLKAEDYDLLDRVIQQYCGIGMCNYQTISAMYDEQLKASGESVSW